jgi:hypothetical protein
MFAERSRWITALSPGAIYTVVRQYGRCREGATAFPLAFKDVLKAIFDKARRQISDRSRWRCWASLERSLRGVKGTAAFLLERRNKLWV